MKTIYHLFRAKNKTEFTAEILESIAEFDKVTPYSCRLFYDRINNSFDYTAFEPFLRWKQSNYTDLSIYNMKHYKVDTLICYNKLSKNTTNNVIQTIPENTKSILDYGGGFGATTLQLAVNFPKKQIYYYDIQNSFFKFLVKKYKIKLENLEILKKCDKKVDTLIMLEFLEHFKQPVDFLEKTVKEIKPKHLIFSYTFRKLGLGHYPNYIHNGKEYYRKIFAKIFNAEVKKRYKFLEQNKNIYLYKI